MKSKSYSVGFFALIFSLVFTVVAMIMSIISNSRGSANGAEYGVGNIGMVIAFCVVCIVLELAALVIDDLCDSTLFAIIADVVRFAVAGLLIACFAVMVSTRGDLMGYIWFSDLERGNANASAALYYALASWILYFLAIVGCAVSLLSDFCKKSDESKIAEAEETNTN